MTPCGPPCDMAEAFKKSLPSSHSARVTGGTYLGFVLEWTQRYGGKGLLWMTELPSGKRLHNYGKIHHFQWENPLFLWPFSIATLNYQRVSSHSTLTSSPVAVPKYLEINTFGPLGHPWASAFLMPSPGHLTHLTSNISNNPPDGNLVLLYLFGVRYSRAVRRLVAMKRGNGQSTIYR